eukprot:scaffold4976_cov161-Amphora_coffeaeformis.AAC.18
MSSEQRGLTVQYLTCFDISLTTESYIEYVKILVTRDVKLHPDLLGTPVCRHQHCKQLCGNILVLAFVVLHRATTTSLAGGCCFGPTVQRNKTIHKKASSYTRNY